MDTIWKVTRKINRFFILNAVNNAVKRTASCVKVTLLLLVKAVFINQNDFQIKNIFTFRYIFAS